MNKLASEIDKFCVRNAQFVTHAGVDDHAAIPLGTCQHLNLKESMFLRPLLSEI